MARDELLPSPFCRHTHKLKSLFSLRRRERKAEGKHSLLNLNETHLGGTFFKAFLKLHRAFFPSSSSQLKVLPRAESVHFLGEVS